MNSTIRPSTAKKPRRLRRLARTCTECRRRKVKCCREDPCYNCRLFKTKCVYASAPSSPLPRGQAASTGLFEVSALKSPGHGERSPRTSTGVSTHSGPFAEQQNNRESRPDQDRPPSDVDERSRTDLGCRVQMIEQMFSTCPRDLIGRREIFSAQPTLDDGRATLNKTRIFGRSHWTSTSYEFRIIQSFFAGETDRTPDNETIESLKSEIEWLLGKCKFSAQASKLARPSRCFLPPDLECPPPSRENADRMGRLYLSRFESSFRILHIPSYWAEFERYYDKHEVGDVAVRLKIQLVTAIGAGLHADYQKDSRLRAEASQWVYAAQNWLSGPMEKDRLTISALQVHCLLLLARQTLSIGGDLIWISMGTVIRTAMQMGLHRDPSHFPKMSMLQAEIRRRLWATILELSVQSSLDAGMPPTVSSDDFDTEPPLNIDDEQIDVHTTTLQSQPRMQTTDTWLQLLLLECLPARLQILRCMNGMHLDIFYDDVLALSAKISAACAECDLSSCREGIVGANQFKINLAKLLLCRFLLSLHGSFIRRARTNTLLDSSVSTCCSSALSILSLGSDEHFFRLVIGGGGLFKSSIFHAALTVGSELMATAAELVPNLIVKRSTPIRQYDLNEAVTTAISHAACRIRFGETNVKLHLVLTMAQSYARAVEAGVCVDVAMAESAKRSLETSHSLMQEYLDSDDVSRRRDSTLEKATFGGEIEIAQKQGSLYPCFDDLLDNTDPFFTHALGPLVSFY